MNITSINKNSLIITILFHAFVIILLFHIGLHSPLPFPEEKGILIDFGNTNEGSGNLEPTKNNVQVNTNSQNDKETILTQNFEEAIVLNSKNKKKQNKNSENEQVIQSTQTQETQPKINVNALYPGNQNSKSHGEGETQEAGNQGNIEGDPNALSSQGNIYGGGNSYNLAGRGLKGALPRPIYPGNEQGKIVVEIYVDRMGNVVKANAGVKGSTILSKPYLDAAYKAALKAKFDAKPDAPELQRGTITYKFSLQ